MAYELNDVMNALRNADKTGNIEDARRLADIAHKLSQVPEDTTRRGFAPHLARGITGVLGAPVDVMAGTLSLIPGVDIPKPVGGRKWIERRMKEVPIDIMAGPLTIGISTLISGKDRVIKTGIRFPEEGVEPKIASEYIGRTIGEISGMLIPGTLVVRAMAGIRGLTGKIASEILRTMYRYPKTTMAGELGAGVGTGIGRYAGEEIAPETPLAKTGLELAGGMVGGMSPAMVGYTPVVAGARVAKQVGRKIFLPFTETGVKYRAGKFLKKQVVSPEKTIAGLEAETIGELPYVAKAGEERFVALWQKFRDADPITDAEAIENIGKSLYKLTNEMRAIGLSDTDILRQITSKRIDALNLKMDNRILTATENANTKLVTLSIARRKADEAIIVRNELEKVMNATRIKKNQLWTEVPRHLKADFSNTRQWYLKTFKDLPIAQRVDIPSELKVSFIAKPKKGQTIETINNMWGLRSKLLETSRIARATGEFNKARLAGETADALLIDLGAKAGLDMTPAGQKLRVALDFTRQFEEKFHQGITGKILGLERTGAPKISPELTLDVSVGRAGLRGIIDIDKVVVTPGAVIATKRYLTRSFVDYSTDKTTGTILPTKAQTWIRNNEQILDKFPDLRTSFTDVTEAQTLANNTRIAMGARKAKLRDPNVSYAARFLNADPGMEVERILRTKNAPFMAREIMRLARRDPRATEGMKGAFIENILEKSLMGTYNELGEQVLSGKAMNAYLNKNLNTFRNIFSQDEILRMRQIANELTKLELAESKLKAVDVDFEDFASNMLRLVSRVTGAQLGRVIARATGGGTVQTPGIFSARMKGFASYLTRDRAFELVKDAITKDPKLLKALLLPIDKPLAPITFNSLRTIDKQMNLWLASSGKRVWEDIVEEIIEEKESKTPMTIEEIQQLKGQTTLR